MDLLRQFMPDPNGPAKAEREHWRSLGICPDCRKSRIPPFLPRCSNCVGNDAVKIAEQTLACELNRAFYGDDPKPPLWERIKRFFRKADAPVESPIIKIDRSPSPWWKNK